MVTDLLDHYRRPGPLTTLAPAQIPLADGLPDDPAGICSAVPGLVIHPTNAPAAGVPEHRLAEKSLRPVSAVLDALLALDPAPLDKARPPTTRMIGTCRTAATLACALLRLRDIPSRARCGFADYFLAGRHVDHWITEYWQPEARRWVRIDAENILGTVLDTPDDIPDGRFLTGGEAWTRYRDGAADGDLFGVAGTENWGAAEISGNAVRDLAALCKREMLPWDEWGRMTAAYAGRAGADYDRLIDTLAATCATDDLPAIQELHRHPDLAAPANLVG
jgi:transglutaminase superfamily protein